MKKIVALCMGLCMLMTNVVYCEADTQQDDVQDILDKEDKQAVQTINDAIRTIVEKTMSDINTEFQSAQKSFETLPTESNAPTPALLYQQYAQQMDLAIESFEQSAKELSRSAIDQIVQNPKIQTTFMDPAEYDTFIASIISKVENLLRKLRLKYQQALINLKKQLLENPTIKQDNESSISLKDYATQYLQASIGEPRIAIQKKYKDTGWWAWSKSTLSSFKDASKDLGKVLGNQMQELMALALLDAGNYTTQYIASSITGATSAAIDQLFEGGSSGGSGSSSYYEEELNEIMKEKGTILEEQAEKIASKYQLQIANKGTYELEIVYIGVGGGDNLLKATYGGSASAIVYPTGRISRELPTSFKTHKTSLVYKFTFEEDGKLEDAYQVVSFNAPGKTLYFNVTDDTAYEKFFFRPQQPANTEMNLSASGLPLDNNIKSSQITEHTKWYPTLDEAIRMAKMAAR